jgi:Restriction endonuclease
MRRKSRPGKSLEALAASLERALGKAGNVSVASPGYLPDRVTGDKREHDVLLTWRNAHHTTVLAIECRDRSRKITVNDVESFHSKCSDTVVSQGVLVSSRGFTRNAIAKARHLGIRTLQLSEVASFNWLATTGITGLSRHITHIAWLFEPAEELDRIPELYTVLMPAGQPIQMDVLKTAAQSEFRKIPHTDTPPPSGKRVIIFTDPGLTLRDDLNQEIHLVGRAIVEVHYEIREEFVPLQLVSYTDRASGTSITDAAVAEMKIGDVKGKLMIVYKEAEGGRVVFVRDRKSEV